MTVFTVLRHAARRPGRTPPHWTLLANAPLTLPLACCQECSFPLRPVVDASRPEAWRATGAPPCGRLGVLGRRTPQNYAEDRARFAAARWGSGMCQQRICPHGGKTPGSTKISLIPNLAQIHVSDRPPQDDSANGSLKTSGGATRRTSDSLSAFPPSSARVL